MKNVNLSGETRISSLMRYKYVIFLSFPGEGGGFKDPKKNQILSYFDDFER